MVIAGIDVIDTDSLDAATDILEEVEQFIICPECNGKASINDFSPGAGYINVACPCCNGYGSILDIDPDTIDDDPEPPSPASPNLLPGPCRECTGSGIKRYWTGGRLSDWIEVECAQCGGRGETTPPCPACYGSGKERTPRYEGRACWYCDGSGADHLAGEETPPAAPVPFDRAAHCRRIASLGGNATVTIHGIHHMRRIGQTGARVTIERHGFDRWRGITTAKGWTGHRVPDLLSDLRAGRALADLDHAA